MIGLYDDQGYSCVSSGRDTLPACGFTPNCSGSLPTAIACRRYPLDEHSGHNPASTECGVAESALQGWLSAPGKVGSSFEPSRQILPWIHRPIKNRATGSVARRLLKILLTCYSTVAFADHSSARQFLGLVRTGGHQLEMRSSTHARKNWGPRQSSGWTIWYGHPRDPSLRDSLSHQAPGHCCRMMGSV